MSGGGDVRGAWEYVNAQLELFPNPVSKILASLMTYDDARRAEGDAKESLRAEQARFFREAKEEFASLPAPHRADPRMKDMMQMGYRAAALALYFDGKKEEAEAACADAVAAAPDLPHPWTLTGVITNEEPARCVPAFRKATALGETSFLPYLCLAYHAVARSDFAEAREMAAAALKRGGAAHGATKSMLLQWQAMSLLNLGGSRDEAGRLFRGALDAAPDDEYAQNNYQRFLQDEEAEGDEEGKSDGRTWLIQKAAILPSIDRSEWDLQSASPDRGDSQIEKMLAEVG